MDHKSKISVATFLAGFSLLLPAWLGLLAAGSPTVVCPLPALTVIPAIYLSTYLHSGLVFRLAVVFPAALFFAWNPGLLRGKGEVPRRSFLLFAGIVVLSVIWFLGSWGYGLQYQGHRYTYAISVVNALWASALSIMFLAAWRRKSSYWISLAAHWMLFAWLGWYAFPYLGELP